MSWIEAAPSPPVAYEVLLGWLEWPGQPRVENTRSRVLNSLDGFYTIQYLTIPPNLAIDSIQCTNFAEK